MSCPKPVLTRYRLTLFVHTVAVLVKKGICTYEQKAEAASKYIQPPGIIQFLIIDGDFHGLVDGGYNGLVNSDEQTDLLSEQEDKHSTVEEKEDTTSKTISPQEFSTEGIAVSRLLRKHHKHRHTSSEITVAILLVSHSVGKDLAEYISNKEPERVKLEGGSRVVLDSAKTSSKTVVFVWVAFCCFLGACGCFCATTSMVFEMEEQATATTTRPRRRRLTMEQVEANLPLGVFDGTRLVFVREETDDDIGEDALVAETPTPNPISLDACSICLDEYVEGERLRYLPCHHTFHAPCIHKWLTERSATCPLCKIDLYEEEEEEEEPPRAAPDLNSSWMSAPPEAATGQGPSIPVETRWRFQMHRRGQEIGAWGRGIFSFGQSRNSGANTELVEPLLAAETQEQVQQREATPSDVEEPGLVVEETQADASRTESTGGSGPSETEEIMPSDSQTDPRPGSQETESQSDDTGQTDSQPTEVASEAV